MIAVSRNDLPSPVTGMLDDNWYRNLHYYGDRDDTSGTSGRISRWRFHVVAGPSEPDGGDEFVVVAPHFHLVRQFQVFVGGDRQMVKQPVGDFDFQYGDPSTPYGPIVSGKGGASFFTLRPRGATRATQRCRAAATR